MARWRNYLNEHGVRGDRHRPRTSKDVLEIVQRAARGGTKVRAIGSGHSSSEVSQPVDGEAWVDVGRLDDVLEWEFYRDSGERFVRIGAGATIAQANELLEELDDPKALYNMGNYDGQTLAGAFSTGTHGSGLRHSPIGDRVVAIEIVTDERHPVTNQRVQRLLRLEPENGAITDKVKFDQHHAGEGCPEDVRVMELEQADEPFEAALVNLGCFGIIVAVTLEVRDAFWLRETERLRTWHTGVDIAALANAHPEFLQLTVQPHRMPDDVDQGHAGKVLFLETARKEVPEPGDDHPPRRRSFWEDLARLAAFALSTGFLENMGLGHPQTALKSVRRTFLHRAEKSGFTSVSHRVHINSLGPAVDATSIDVWVPLDKATDAVQHVIGLAQSNETLDGEWNTQEWFHTSPVGVRIVARSRALLAPSYDGPKCSLEIPLLYDLSELASVHEDHVAYRDRMLRTLEKQLTDPPFGGRPHWGQRNWMNDARAQEMYGDNWVAWKRVYARFNAFGTFSNAFTARMGL